MLFHKEIYIPEELKFKLQAQDVPLTYSRHAIIASQTDKYGFIKLKPMISFKSKDVVELELINNVVVKLVVRLPYNDTLDIIYAIAKGWCG